MRKSIILCFLLALLVPTVRAQLAPPSDGFTLAQCVAYARANNPNIKISRINEQISGVQVKQVIGQNLPQVGISGSVVDNYKLPIQLLPAQFFGGAPGEFVPLRFGTQFSTTLTGRVDQKLFDPTLGLALKAAKLQISLQSKVTLQAEQTQAYNVAQAYYQALVIDLQRRLITRNLNSSDTLMQQELVRLKNGTTREIDFGRIQLNRNNLQSQLEQTNRNFSQALNRLKFQMGMPIDQPLALQALEIENELQVVELVETNANFVENRPDFQQLLINTQLADLNREANNRGYLPSFGLYATYGTNAQRESFNFLDNGLPWFQSGAVGVTMSWNLFDGNQRRYRDQENRLNLETLRLQQLLTRESAQLNLSNAQVSYQNLVSDIQRERDNITLAQRILTVTELEYKEGIATSVTLIDSKDALTTAQNNLANKLISLYQARLDYENAQGTIIDYVTKK